MSWTPRPLVALLLAALLLAACGSGDDPLTNDAADDAVGRALLTVKDLPSGWEKTSDEAPDDSDGDDSELENCVGTKLDLSADTIAESNTRTFERATSETDQQQLSVSTAAFPEDRIDELFEVVATEKFAGCMAKAFEAGLADGQSTAGVSVEAGKPKVVESQADDADRSAHITAPVTLQVETLRLDGQFDLVMVSRGQLVSLLFGFSLGDPIGTSRLDRLGDLLVDRQEV